MRILRKVMILLIVFALFGCATPKFKVYEGKDLNIAVIGNLPEINENQVKLTKLTFGDILNNLHNTYDALIVSEENLIEAAQEQYTDIYLNSPVPTFFIGTHTPVSFTLGDVNYEDWMDWSSGKSYAIGILKQEDYLNTWGYGLYNDEMNDKNIKEVYTRIFTTIEEVK